MRKVLSIEIAVFSLLLVFCLTLSMSCENGIMQEILELKIVSFNTNGGSFIPPQRLLKGQLLIQPDDPVKADFIFAGWYEDNDTFALKWDFNSSPNNDLTLHAKWVTKEKDEKISIANAAVTVTAPVKGGSPAETADVEGTGYTCTAVTWDPADNPFKGGVVYTVTVTLAAEGNYTFAGLKTASINGQAADVKTNDGYALVISYTFAETDTRDVTNIAVEAQPRLVYVHGETLELAGLVLRLTFDTSETENVAFENFVSKNISTDLKNGEVLSRSTHNNQSVTVHYGDKTASTDKLTVNPKALTITGASHTKLYDGTTTANGVIVTLSGVLPEDENNVQVGTVTANYTSANIGTQTIDITAVTLTGSAAGNYTVQPENNFQVTGGGIKALDVTITLSIEAIKDGAPFITGVTLSKTGAGSIQTINITGGPYTSIKWEVAGVGAYAGQFVTGSGASFNLNANDEKYGTIGGHTLMLTVYIEGNQYMVNIRFTIVE